MRMRAVDKMRAVIVKDSLRRWYSDTRLTLMTAGIDEEEAGLACRAALAEFWKDLDLGKEEIDAG